MGQHKTSIHWERDTEHFNIKSFNRDHVIRFENGVGSMPLRHRNSQETRI